MDVKWDLISEAIRSMLSVLDNKRDKEHERATKALGALSEAYYATEEYYQVEFDDSVTRRKKELELATKWDKVANMLREFDSNLWSRFNLKSRFWATGATWSPEEIKNANIGLSQIRKDARFHLISRQRKPK